ncbi:hypothetical protein vseg_009024 [Gypsophila vaccaria]
MEEINKVEKVDGNNVSCEKEEEEKLIEGTTVLDFDVLCSTVAMQSHGKWRLFEDEDGGDDVVVGVLRMWEGEVLDCFDDHTIAIQSFCCPCYRFGKNMKRAGQGSCFVQATVYLLLAAAVFLSCVAFIVTGRRCFLYLAIAFAVSVGTYLGFFRTQMRKKFNIKGTDSSLDDCVFHLVCPCCTISQESRTLEMNNVQGGTWHGRGDTICVGTFGEGAKALTDLRPPCPVLVESHDPKLMPNNKDVDSC